MTYRLNCWKTPEGMAMSVSYDPAGNIGKERARNAVFIHSAELEKYHYPPDSPFKTERAALTCRMLTSMGLLSDQDMLSPQSAGRETLEKFHTPRYLDAMLKAERGELGVEGLHMGLGSEDCPVFVGMYDYASLACGATLAGVEIILAGKATDAFNPSGGYHHAGPEKAAGFCYVNDVVLACMALAEAGKRVLFLDVDVHHCDGVQDAFYDRSDVLTVSFHESGKTLFPGTGFEDEIGVGAGRGYSVNVPLPVETYDEAYMKAFVAVAVPIAKAFDPDVIVLQIGMDSLAGDPLGHLSLTNNVCAEVIAETLRFGKPILAVGGGGYHPENTARGWALAWSIMSGRDRRGAEDLGLGGVMLETADWQGGLRDRMLIPDVARRAAVDAAIAATIEAVKANVFATHGL
ncbi:MAG: acetoin utilization protein AcuC [Planctomycetota bacterium]|jgi:acetoin utilization protein AcuC